MEKSPIENNIPKSEVKRKRFINMPDGTVMDITDLTETEVRELIEQLRESLKEQS